MSPPANQTDAIPTTGTVVLPPAPRSLDALGRHHTLEAALAELVDNSIDAGAKHLLIRFIQVSGHLEQMVVVDDGAGMDDAGIDVAMTVGGERKYDSSQIGRFGLGLKSASFSQADSLTVLSRRQDCEAVGRRWRLERAKADFTCEVIDPGFASEALNAEWELPVSSAGTVVRWDAVRGFPSVADRKEVERFLHEAFGAIQTHLGLIYHRLLEDRRVRIYVDAEDLVEGLGPRVEVSPIDPFAYPRTGAPGWPKTLPLATDSQRVNLECHVWPGRSTLDAFRLDGDRVGRQGIYVYYNDRVIQRGGWNGLVHADKQLNLARARIDVSGDVPQVLKIKPEKNGIETGPRFSHLVTSARTYDDASFATYLETARTSFKEANRRRRLRTSRIPPGSGFDPKIRRAIRREIPMKDDEEPLSIRWAPLGPTEFFSLDREDSTLWLNKRYRSALLGGRAGSLNDLPVVKTLLYLLFEEIYAGQNIGPRDRDNLDLWQELLTRAAETEAS